MKKILLSISVLFFAVSALIAKDETKPWETALVNEINRMPMHASFETDSPKISLNGMWKFQWFENFGEQDGDFYSPAKDDSAWALMPVPGMWELNGYGDPIYVNIGYCWRGHFKNTPPLVPSEHNHVGQYRRHVNIPESWNGEDIILSIGSVTSNVQVYVNGKFAGYSEDSKLSCEFDITKFVKPGDNLIALEVHRWCDGTYVEDQDFWRFCGIARDTYLTALPKDRILDIHVQAHADGAYDIDVKTTKGIKKVELYLEGHGLKIADLPAHGKLEDIKPWTAETPNLYNLKVRVLDKYIPTQSAFLRIGFRDTYIEDGLLKLNGVPLMIKGADRHELSPVGGYVVSEEEMLRDIRIMKDLNINAVRTSHYPNDPRWLDLCDEYGIYVVDEANLESHGMGYGPETLARNPHYALTHIQRPQRMIQRDFNHPSVIVWSMGNEAGYGENFEAAYDMIKAFDPGRPVQYERALPHGDNTRNGVTSSKSDIYCPMYFSPRSCVEYLENNPERPLIQCEYAHAMGNSMGGLKTYMDLVRKYAQYQGGFIWDFADQAVKWPSKKSKTGYVMAYGGDFNDYDPSDVSFNCNGIIAADRSYHPHAYEVQYQYQNIWTYPTDLSQGEVMVENEYRFTDLSRYYMHWDVLENGVCVASGNVEDIDVAPMSRNIVMLPFKTADFNDLDGELFVNLTYRLKSRYGILPADTKVASQQLALRGARKAYSPKIAAGGVKYSFDKKTGALASCTIDGRELLSEPLMPCFGRAVTENDLGAKLEKKLAAWQYPAMILKSFSENAKGAVAVYDIDGMAKVTVTYTYLADGSLKVRQKMTELTDKAPYVSLSDRPKNTEGNHPKARLMMRFGMETAMGGEFENIRYYGNGPVENYVDRKSSQSVGLYNQKVADQYWYGYVRPQESGCHTDVRYIEVVDNSGCGLCFKSDDHAMSATVLDIARTDIDMTISGGHRSDHSDMESNDRGDHRHSLELRSDGKTHVILDGAHMGLGCVTSWGALPVDPYKLEAGERTFEFTITPIKR